MTWVPVSGRIDSERAAGEGRPFASIGSASYWVNVPSGAGLVGIGSPAVKAFDLSLHPVPLVVLAFFTLKSGDVGCVPGPNCGVPLADEEVSVPTVFTVIV